MQQLLDRVWCRFFHGAYHVPQERLHGWQFFHCLRCKTVWPRRDYTSPPTITPTGG